MATDAWQQARAKVVEWWREVRPEQTESLDVELDQTRAQLLAAREAGDADAEQGLVTDWQIRLQVLLRENPALAGELQSLLDQELAPTLTAEAQNEVASLVMKASASGRGRVYQAGRDQNITER
ncbi:hypothetical protein ACIBMX_48595 [Streptomyces phaeochromogenes]|uniref:hypothetical protein n=1 Tax=Streptomyces phaeochromogenes TaxID=1923 RepID=UPI0033CAA06C